MLDRPLLIVTGKGGVGRSAVTAAIALRGARRGHRVLAIAVDRGTGLATHLGATRLLAEPTTTPAGIEAALIDPGSALEEYVRRRVGSAPIGAAARVFRLLAATVPGVRDIVLIGKVVFEATRGPWDSVVVDAPPSGQIQSLLEAPATIADLVPRGTVHDHAIEVGAILADEGLTELVTIATPEELALTEASQIVHAADRAGLSSIRTRVLNRVLPAPGFEAVPPGDGPRVEAATLHLEVRASQQRLIAAGTPAISLPLLFGTHRPLDVSRHLAKMLESP